MYSRTWSAPDRRFGARSRVMPYATPDRRFGARSRVMPYTPPTDDSGRAAG